MRKDKSNRKRPKKVSPGPKPSITLKVVKRVSKRFGSGVPLEQALAAECNPKINLETWKKALQAHPELSPHYEAAKGRFLAESIEKLQDAKDLKFLCWLLERRHSDLFAKPAAVSVSVNNTNIVAGLQDDVLVRAQQIAREQAKGETGGK